MSTVLGPQVCPSNSTGKGDPVYILGLLDTIDFDDSDNELLHVITCQAMAIQQKSNEILVLVITGTIFP